MRLKACVLAASLMLSTSGCLKASADLAMLRNEYPVVHYEGPKKPPTVTLQKSRPAQWVPIDRISKRAAGAIVVSEDWAFYHHNGIDTKQIEEAIHRDWEEGRYARGASTITQQVVRNVFLTKNKSMVRKVEEIYLAVRLEQVIPKRKILEIYFNIAEWGEGIFGIGAAARHYFQKDPSELTAKEGAFLAMLLPSPKRYSQSFRAKKLTDYAQDTVDSILDKMVQARLLTPEEREAAGAEPLPFEAQAAMPSPSPSPFPFPSASPSPEEDDAALAD